MKIIVDCDNVVADLVGGVCSLVNEYRSTANEWNWFMNYPEPKASKVREAMKSPGFWAELPLIEDSEKGIAWLRGNGHQLLWVTVPFPYCNQWVEARESWLIRNFRVDKHNEPIITVSNAEKYHIEADVIIDDMPRIIDEYSARRPEAKTCLFWSELNQNLNREMVNWEDIMSDASFLYGRAL